MTIYKVVAHFGLDSELNPRIFCDYQKAYEVAQTWYDEGADSVNIYQEKSDFESGYFITTKSYNVRREE